MEDAVILPGACEAHRPVILLVEDNVLVRFTSAEILRDAGFDVLEAVDASEALALLTTGHPLSLVVSDVRMPGHMDGVQLAGVIKNTRPNLPVVLFSSHLDHPDNAADEFLQKPASPERLVEVAKRLIDAGWQKIAGSSNDS